MKGTILKGVGGFYTVLAEDGATYTLRAQAKLRRQKLTPMVGDRVEIMPGEGEQHGWLAAILPRRNWLKRPPVANIDVIVVVVAAATPAPDLLLVDQMLMAARSSEIQTALAVNKLDLDPESGESIARQYEKSGATVFPLSVERGEGINALREALSGKVFAFAGQSGVGKSTLINRLYGLTLETGGLSEKIERGKHTTRHSELIPLPDGSMALDTPGFSLLELPITEPTALRSLVPEFFPYEGQCYFASCVHLSEPNCPVRAAVESGEIPEQRWRRYQTIYDEMNTRWRERYD